MSRTNRPDLDAMLRAAFVFQPESVALLAERIRCHARAEAAAQRRARAKSQTHTKTNPMTRHGGVSSLSNTPAPWSAPVRGCSDEQLLQRARGGDAAAFGELASHYNRRLMAAALQIVRNRSDAEDIVQTASLNAFAHIDSFRGDCAFSTWLLRITVNEAIARSREVRREQVNTEDISDFEEGEFVERPIGEWRMNPETMVAQQQVRELLRAELNRLPVKYSAVFLMRDVEGFSTAEVAEALGLTLTAVRVRLLRARSKLRERLREHFSGPAALPLQRPMPRGGFKL